MKKLICAVVFLIILGIGGMVFLTEFRMKEVQEMKEIKVGGVAATWEYVERDISQRYFYNLDDTSTYQQIEEQIGKPNGERISEYVFPYYQINDDLYAVIAFSLDKSGKYDKVKMISLYTKDKYLDTIYPKHNTPTTNFSW